MHEISVNLASAMLTGDKVEDLHRTIADVRDIFEDQGAAASLSDGAEVYSVQVYAPVGEGVEGALQWGNTTVQPGLVGDEYFMTKGHFHAIRNRGEFYITNKGKGALILMAEGTGETWFEEMSPGSVHYIPGNTAHRTANTGSEPLVFTACWPSDAGHDYATIASHGFGARLMERSGKPTLVPRG